jgi:cytosine/adenosine deaminase-related metal-dependent hydrolase
MQVSHYRLDGFARRVLAPDPQYRLATPDQSNGRVLFDNVVSGGRTALAGGAMLRVGEQADLVELAPVVIDTGDRALDHWIFGTGRVDRVWRAGQEVVAGGRHRHRGAISERFEAVARRLLS